MMYIKGDYMKKLWILVIAIACLANDPQIDKVLKVYDGDTFTVDLKDCKQDVLCKGLSIRVLGIDTPELKGKTAKEKNLAVKAKAVAEAYFARSRLAVLKECSRDKYFRLDCDVINQKGEILSEVMINSGLAVEYWGGTKTTDWSK